MNEQIENLLNAIGSLPEMLRVFTNGMLDNGFSDKETMEYGKEFLHCLFSGRSTGGSDDG